MAVTITIHSLYSSNSAFYSLYIGVSLSHGCLSGPPNAEY